jgi:peptidoglycan/LPS O-acetylase OafA/YrhL
MTNPSLSDAGAPRRPLVWRSDIQALRGLAVLLVVIEHAKFPYLRGGFLGVDIFFVISGFLMTRILLEALEHERFSFRTFYARRARRLLPAAYATILASAALAYWLLDAFEFRNFVWQMGGSFAFLANIALWFQSDYFGTGASLKPLLHLWSLSLEEQYYLALPLLLFLTSARLRGPVVIILTGVSLALCLTLGRSSPSAAFYFLPTRAWELGIGSLVAFARFQPGLFPARKVLRLAAALVLVGLPVLVDEVGHPGWPALVVCLATALLLFLGERAPLPRGFAPLIAIGDRSYSLYLVHWPLFAFANNIHGPAVPGWLNAALLGLSFVATEIQYRGVERPFRHLAMTPRTLMVLVALPLFSVALAAWLSYSTPAARLAQRSPNQGLDITCASSRVFSPKQACRTAPEPEILIWGDSFAMHLVDGVQASGQPPLEQATLAFCGPFLGLAPMKGSQHGLRWARDCIAFNDAVLRHLERTPSISTVILSSALVQYLPGAEVEKPTALLVQAGAFQPVLTTQTMLAEALARTTEAIRRAGRKVVFVAPPPSTGDDLGRCLSRIGEHKVVVPDRSSCDFPRATFHHARRFTRDFLAQVEQGGIAPVLHLETMMCADGLCRTRMDGVPLYLDGAHLSRVGARKVGERLGLSAQARQIAR